MKKILIILIILLTTSACTKEIPSSNENIVIPNINEEPTTKNILMIILLK